MNLNDGKAEFKSALHSNQKPPHTYLRATNF